MIQFFLNKNFEKNELEHEVTVQIKEIEVKEDIIHSNDDLEDDKNVVVENVNDQENQIIDLEDHEENVMDISDK